MPPLSDLVRWDAATVLESRRLLGVDPPLERPTPCAGWTLSGLLAHLVVQHEGFARAVRGVRSARADWAPRPLADPVAEYAAACAEVTEAFAALRDADAPVWLPEIRADAVPAAVAVGFHLLDYVVHGWDVAATVGGRVELTPDVLGAGLAIAGRVPSGAARTAPGAAFAPVLPARADADPLARILLLTGRDPDWRISP